MNARTAAIARRSRVALRADRRARLVRACQHTSRTVRSLSRALGVCERTVRRDLVALGPQMARTGERYRATYPGLSDEVYFKTCDDALGDGR